MHKSRGRTKGRNENISPLRQVKYTDTKKDGSSLLVNAALQVEFWILVLGESNSLGTWKESENLYRFVLHYGNWNRNS